MKLHDYSLQLTAGQKTPLQTLVRIQKEKDVITFESSKKTYEKLFLFH